MPSQPEYGAQVTFSLCSGSASSYPGTAGTAVLLLVTKEHFGGTPQTWSLTVPDLMSVQAFPGGDIRAYALCSVAALTNIPFVFDPRTTHDGDVFTSVAYWSNVLNK